MKKLLSATIAGLAVSASLAALGSVMELAVPLWSVPTGSAAVEAGEPVGIVSGKAVPLPCTGGAVAVATEGASSNAVATVKAGCFLLPAATNLAATAVGTTVHWSDGRVVADGGTTNALGKLLFIEAGRACVKVEP